MDWLTIALLIGGLLAAGWFIIGWLLVVGIFALFRKMKEEDA